MADMIKFFKGLEASLPATGVNGAFYVTTDEGAIYLGTGTGMKRLGDFVQVAKVADLPAKAHESCLYYCVAENILAKWNGTEWKQINKQPTAEEMKTLLGLGSLAYKSEVAEGDLNTDLAAKINAASGAQHSHTNKDVIDGITAEKVSAWDAAEKNAEDYADGLNDAMNTRVEALEAIDHEHANKALLDTYTQTEANLADAVAKKHEHANKTELDKIAAGDVAKWNGVVADHLTSADKTALEDSIGDVNTALETYKTSNNEALAGVKATADAAAVKADVDTALAGKVDKVEGKSLVADTEIARLATLANYDDTQVKADIAKKADTEAMTTELGKKVDKVDGYSLVSDTEIARLADVDNYDDTALAGRVSTAEGKITALEGASATHATKEELNAVDAKFADYVTSESYATDKQGIDEAIADRYTKEEADGKFAIKGADAYDDTELAGRVTTAEGKIADLETASATHAVKTEVEAALALKADKSALEATDATLAEVKTTVDNFFAEDAAINDTIDTLKEIANYIATDKEGAADIIARVGALEGKVDVDKVSTAIAVETNRATEAEEALAGRLDTLEAIDHEAYKAADATLKTELQAEIDADVKALADGQVKTNTEAIATKANSADVYTKTETFTKDEVNAAIASAVEAAHTWGEF